MPIQSPLTPPPGYQIQNLPEFIRKANSGTKIVPAPTELVPGGKIVADVEPKNPHTIQVREPQIFTQPVQTHESTHIYQLSRTPEFSHSIISSANASTGKKFSSVADYGGVAGLEQALKNHKTIADFNAEQQAEMVADYQRLTADAMKRRDAAGLSRITAAYHPFIRQFSRIPAKGDDLMKAMEDSRVPEPPGLPPATVVGVPMMPDPLLGGEPVYTASQLKSMAAVRNPAATGQVKSAPKIGQIKRYKNGNIGVWDGHGWAAQPH